MWSVIGRSGAIHDDPMWGSYRIASGFVHWEPASKAMCVVQYLLVSLPGLLAFCGQRRKLLFEIGSLFQYVSRLNCKYEDLIFPPFD